MKNISLLFTIIAVILCEPFVVCAENNLANTNDVTYMSVFTTQINDGAISALQKTVDSTQDIEYIIYLLNHLALEKIDEDDMWQGAHAGSDLQINIQCGDGERYSIVFPVHGRHQYAVVSEYELYYETSYDEINRLNEFCRAAALNQTHYPNEHITYTPSDWAQNDVDMAIGGGLVPEWNQINYTGDIPRVEVCQLIDNLLSVKGIESASEENPFSDTNDIAVAVLYELGIVDGKSDSEFCPYDYITREEFAKILSDTYDVLGLGTVNGEHTYFDADDISDWAEEYVNKMYQAGLMCGKDNNEFKPKDSITKEEVIVTLLRLSEI